MKKRTFHTTIAAKYFLATSLLIILPICIFYQIANKFTLNTTLAQKKSSDLVTLNTYSTNICTLLDSVSAVSKLASEDEELQEFLRDARDSAARNGKSSYLHMDNRPYFKPYAESLLPILSFTLMDPEFYIIGEQQLNLNRLTYFFNPNTVQDIQKNPDQEHWTKTFSIEFLETGQIHKVFSLLTPARDASGTTIGYVVAFVDTSSLSEMLNAYGDGIYVIEGNNIIASQKNLPANTSLFSEMQISYSLLLEDNSVIIDKSEDSLIITTRYFEPLDLHLLLVSSYHTLKDQLASTFPPLLTIVLYIIVLALLLTFVITHFQTKHIVTLRHVMNRVKEGDFSIRYEPKTNDEIAELGITFNSLLDRIQELMLQQKNNQKAKRKMELQMIQEQIKPHFLYNVLEMINSLIRCNMTPNALSAVESLASFYRITLSRGSDSISIDKEIQVTENYLNLQKMRYIEFMDYILAFSPQIRNYIIPKLTLQPLIENSIYHGIKEKNGKGIVCV
ncbi:MAG: histidine kinase, partial [Lachnospiraceae bacterium]|nr:histidine kinase [Lachnospiraceae bacterium]